jgi:alpha-L-fucosidase
VISGGFQIGKGVWEGDWKNPNCPKAQKKRELVLTWMDAYMDYGMMFGYPGMGGS